MRRIVVADFESPALIACLYDVAMVGRAVEKRGGHLGIAEHAGPFSEALAKGDRIRFGIRCQIGDVAVINGTTGIVKDVLAEDDGHALVVANINGRKLLFSSRDVVDDQGRVRLATDYASTVWSSQGLTSHTATIVADASFDRRDMYVALSRAKERSILYLDSRVATFAVRAETGFDRTASEISVEERREHLVRQMSKWQVKSLTLDFVAPVQQHAPVARERRASVELSL